MVFLFLTFFLACLASLQACPEPMSVHIQNYEGPIILHTANCEKQQHHNHDHQKQCNHEHQQQCNHNNQQQCHHDNQHKQHGCCETECTCVSKQSYAPYAYGGSLATNVGTGWCPVADVKPLVYCVCNGCGCNGYSNDLYGNRGYQGYPNCQSKISGCF